MTTQPIAVGPLGEAPGERRARPRRQAGTQQYFQGLPKGAGLGIISIGDRSLAGDEVLERIFSQSGSDMPTFIVDLKFESRAADWPRSVIEAIDSLLASKEDEVPPTDYAYEKARSVVESAYGRVRARMNVPEVIPRPSITTDDVGGIRFSWRANGKQVRANFGARDGLRSYIYFESDRDHDVEELNADRLSGRLSWLTGR
ncbi:MAG: hypothetical protein ACRD5K_11605 [Candidatus Acidiferrales bacterium]